MHSLRRWAFASEASTRSAALLRMGLVMVLWARWARPFAWYRVDSLPELFASAVFFPASLALFVGLCTRWSSVLVALSVSYAFYYLGVFQGDGAWVHHHTHLLVYGSWLLVLVPCGRSLSLDRWWQLRRCAQTGQLPPRERANIFGLRLISILLSSVYFWAAFDKISWPFMSGQRLQHHLSQYYYGADFPDVWGFEPLTAILAGLTVLLEFGLAIAVLNPRWFRYLIVPGLLLHGAFYVLLPVSTYTATMWCLYLACIDPDEFERFFAGLLEGRPLSGNQHLEEFRA